MVSAKRRKPANARRGLFSLKPSDRGKIADRKLGRFLGQKEALRFWDNRQGEFRQSALNQIESQNEKLTELLRKKDSPENILIYSDISFSGSQKSVKVLSDLLSHLKRLKRNFKSAETAALETGKKQPAINRVALDTQISRVSSLLSENSRLKREVEEKLGIHGQA